MRVVLDSNVIISGLAYPRNERYVLQTVARDHELFVSPVIFDEVARSLTRKFNWGQSRVTAAIAELRRTATIIDPAPEADAVPGGHADNRILDCAVAAQADFLVTGDKRHLLPLGEHRGTRIVNAARFLEALAG